MSNQASDKAIINAIRTQEDLTEQQVDKLLSLHIDKFEENHGVAKRNSGESDAIHLFFTNAKRIRHDLKKLSQFSNKDNPVAIIKAHGHGATTGKPDNRHFDSEAPCSALLNRKTRQQAL